MKSFFVKLFIISIFTLMFGCSGDDSSSNPTDPNDPGDSGNPVGTVTDIDGNVYSTVTIGNQIWMSENLKVIHYRNGDSIITFEYNNDVNNVATYGRLYKWYAVNDSRNIAPVGWHVPTDAEWQVLADYLGGGAVAGGKLKEMDTTHWIFPNTGATNESGFTALPGGNRFRLFGSFESMGHYAYFWSSTEASSGLAWFRDLGYSTSEIFRRGWDKSYGYSVRCVKD